MISLSPDLASACPGLTLFWTLGVLEQVGQQHSAVTERLSLLQKTFAARPSPAQLADIPAIATMRRCFKALGLDPARWRPSAEALCRRLVQGRGLYRINDVVDAGNVVSAETCLCLGLYDAARIRGGIVCRIGRDAETYQDVTGRETNAARKIVLVDEAGVFGAPTDDSYRTRIRQDTRSLLYVFFAPSEAFSELAEIACEELSSLLKTSCNYVNQRKGRIPELI